jgi:hypothetical protein
MESLIQLVAESFARHGIECPKTALPMFESPLPVEAPQPAALPEHNFRKTEEPSLAT